MSGLSLMQTRSFIDRLGDLDEEITKVCRAADVMSKGTGKEHAAGVDRLKEACEALQDKQKYVREAKDCLLGLDGFMHALSGEMRQLMEHPEMGHAVGRVSERMQGPLGAHVTNIVEETVDGLRRVSAAVKALREDREDAKRAGSIKESAQALSKVCEAAENTLKKALKHAESPPKMVKTPAPQSGDEEVIVEEVVDKAAKSHGYDLTAGLPPEFLENAQKKKDEAAAKKDEGQDEAADKDDDEKAGSKKADSLTPGNKSKGPKDEGEEDQGWIPGHRTTQEPTDEKEGGKKAAHGYDLTADSKDPDPSMEDDIPGEDTDGEPVVDKSAKGKVPEAFLKNIEKMKAKGKDGDKGDDKGDDKAEAKDDAKDSGKPWEKDKKAAYHGYELTEAPDHGYELTA